jgi:cell division protein FtsB
MRLRSAVIFPLIATLLVMYFGYYTFFGDRSLIRLMQLEAKIQAVQTRLDNAEGEHAAYRARVEHMRPETLDPDLLDEQSRRVLNYTQPDEIVIYTKDY